MNMSRMRLPYAPRAGMFCRLGLLELSLPVAAPVLFEVGVSTTVDQQRLAFGCLLLPAVVRVTSPPRYGITYVERSFASVAISSSA